MEAVKIKNFGEKTRLKYEWHPAKELCIRFNVPNPYPDSKSVGVMELQKRIRTTENFALMNLEFSTTSKVIQKKAQISSETKESTSEKTVSLKYFKFD